MKVFHLPRSRGFAMGLLASVGGACLLGAGSIVAASLPYASAGLTERQAAQVLIERFTYGATPGQVEQVVAQGLDRWFEEQLQARQGEAALGTRLSQFPALGMTHQQLFAKFPSGSQSTAHARRFYDLIPPADAAVDNTWRNRKLAEFRKQQGYQSQEEDLYRQLAGQKIVRAVYAQNQLAEVLTDFWFNHFYVTSSSFRSRPWVLAYEGEAIRPLALGKFRELLGAATKHPAKIQATLGDAQKSAVPEAQTSMGLAFAQLESQGKQATVDAVRKQIERMDADDDLLLQRRFWPASGPNLEFSRLLFQQTLGAGGAYGQKDVEEAARVFTGWSVLPYGVNEQWFVGGFAAASAAGFVQQGSFVFRADRHDATAKQVLGKQFLDGRGYEEGEELLDTLAAHPASARNIATALARQFVGTKPGTPLIDSLAKVFGDSGGDVRAVLHSLVQSDEFWRAAAAQEKQKSPFEYAVSAMRAAQAEVKQTAALAKWIADMGQPLYAYQDSNGVPYDKQWISAGSLTARMKFALQLGAGQIEGIDLPGSARAEALAMQIASPQFQHR